MKKYNLSKKYEAVRTGMKVKCKCGHVNSFEPTSKATKIICSYCGYYVYRNEREKFKELMKGKMKNGQ